MENTLESKPISKNNSHEVGYVFGTHDAELERLGLQHRAWRPEVSDAWRRAGFTTGQTIVDLGCGPGYASIDLAKIVGPRGRVIAVDGSGKFLAHLQETAKRENLHNISSHLIDLDRDDLPTAQAHGAYVRWVFAFLRNRRKVLENLTRMLAPGAALVMHEYFHYHTFQLTGHSEIFGDFVNAVVRSWRADGGEPDVGLDLLKWTEELGLHIESVLPIVHIVSPKNYLWQWPKSWIEIAPQHLMDRGYFTEEQAQGLLSAFESIESGASARIVTPAVLEIIARKRA